MTTLAGASLECSSIPNVLQDVADRTPHEIAIHSISDAPLSYQQLYHLIASTVAALNRAGLGCNDRIAVALPNGPEMAAAFLAIASGATCAPLNPTYRTQEFEFYLSDLNAKALILPAGSNSPAREVACSHNIPILELASIPNAALGSFRLMDESGTDLMGDESSATPIFSTSKDIALVLHTSGTTARPKIVPLTQENLCRSAHNIQQTLQLNTGDCCLNVMPLFHIHGLVAALLSTLVSGGSIVCTPGFQPQLFLDWLEQFQPTWYSAVPTIHQSILAQLNSRFNDHSYSSLRFIRSSSAALPPKTLADLEAVFKVPVIEAYGMTEAAHQMTSNPLPPNVKKIGSVGVAAGPDVAIMDQDGSLLQPGQVGEVVIRGTNVTPGYANNLDANHQAFFNGWFRTGDQGCFDSDGYLFLKGRIKELINRGGEKVIPQEIDNCLLEIAGIAQAATFAVPHPSLGEDVASAVVLKPGTQLSEQEIRQTLFTRLASFKVPSQVIFVNVIPQGATGKLQRMGLAEKLADQLQQPYSPPSAPIEGLTTLTFAEVVELQLVNIFQRVLGKDKISVEDNFYDLGGNSLASIQLVDQIEKEFKISLSAGTIFEFSSIKELASIISRNNEMAIESSSLLVTIQPNGSNPPLFLVNALGTGMFIYRDLSRYLGPNQPVYGIRARGLNRNEPPVTTVEDMAKEYIEAIRTVKLNGPYYLAGLCSGGTIAFELAQQLLSQGEEVAFLGLIDAPHPIHLINRNNSPTPKPDDLLDKLKESINFKTLTILIKDITGMLSNPQFSLNEKRMFMSQRLNKLMEKVSEKIEDETLKRLKINNDFISRKQRLELVQEASRRAISRYRPKFYLGKITLFRCSENSNADWLLGWGDLTTLGIEVQEIPGDHQTMISEPNIRILATKITRCLNPS